MIYVIRSVTFNRTIILNVSTCEANILGNSKLHMNPLILQLHKNVLQFVTDQQALEYQGLHFSTTVSDLDHFLHIRLDHIAEDKYPIHLSIPIRRTFESYHNKKVIQK